MGLVESWFDSNWDHLVFLGPHPDVPPAKISTKVIPHQKAMPSDEGTVNDSSQV